MIFVKMEMRVRVGFGGIYRGHEVDTFYSVVLWAPPGVKRQQRHI